jgi:hypothetical protein
MKRQRGGRVNPTPLCRSVFSGLNSGTVIIIKVGVKCSAECELTGEEIEIYDHEGANVATGTLGDVPWSGATALSGVEVELEAPNIERRYRWTAKFPKPDLELAHEKASCTFAFGTARQPDHVVTIEVIDKDTKTPMKNAKFFSAHIYTRAPHIGAAPVRVEWQG